MAQFQDGLRRACLKVRGIPALPKLCRLDDARYAQFNSNFLSRCSRVPLKAQAQASIRLLVWRKERDLFIFNGKRL